MVPVIEVLPMGSPASGVAGPQMLSTSVATKSFPSPVVPAATQSNSSAQCSASIDPLVAPGMSANEISLAARQVSVAFAATGPSVVRPIVVRTTAAKNRDLNMGYSR